MTNEQTSMVEALKKLCPGWSMMDYKSAIRYSNGILQDAVEYLNVKSISTFRDYR